MTAVVRQMVKVVDGGDAQCEGVHMRFFAGISRWSIDVHGARVGLWQGRNSGIKLPRMLGWFRCRAVEFEVVVRLRLVCGIVGRVRVAGEVVVPAGRSGAYLGQVALDVFVTEHPYEPPVPWRTNDATRGVLVEPSGSRSSGGWGGGEEGALGIVVSLQPVEEGEED